MYHLQEPDHKAAWERLKDEGVLEDKLINYMWQSYLGNEDQEVEICTDV